MTHKEKERRWFRAWAVIRCAPTATPWVFELMDGSGTSRSDAVLIEHLNHLFVIATWQRWFVRGRGRQ